MTSAERRLNVLFLPKWYPGRNDPFNGIFIKNHAKAVATRCNVSVLFVNGVVSSENRYELELDQEDNVYTFRSYFEKSNTGFQVLDKISNGLRYIRAFRKGLSAVEELSRPDLVHAHVLTRTVIAAMFLRLKWKVPYIVTEHWTGYMPQDGRYNNGIRSVIARIVFSRAEAATVVSNILREAMQSHGLNNTFHIIPNVVDTFPPKPDLAPGDIQLVNISDFDDRMKNISGLIKVMPAVVAKYPTARLILIGDGEDRQMLEGCAKEAGLLETRIFFKGYVPHETVFEYISESTMVIINSRFESFSVVAAESLACGTPVITTACGGPEEFISDKFGRVIAVEDGEALLNAILDILGDRQRFDPAELQAYARTKFGEEKVAGEFYDLYHSILKKFRR
jgi:glycosyltransferase involved in cell wall biosynthesis